VTAALAQARVRIIGMSGPASTAHRKQIAD
jgi:hypothetical protein